MTKDKLLRLHNLLNSFSHEEKDRIIEILQIVIELIHSPLSI